MQNRHIINKPDITPLHTGSELVFACDEVDCIEGFGLRFCKAWNVFCARPGWCVPDQEPSGEFEDYFSGALEDCSALVKRWVSSVAGSNVVSVLFVEGAVRRMELTYQMASLPSLGCGSGLAEWRRAHCTPSMRRRGCFGLPLRNSCVLPGIDSHRQCLYGMALLIRQSQNIKCCHY
jgi:hypothetical protein